MPCIPEEKFWTNVLFKILFVAQNVVKFYYSILNQVFHVGSENQETDNFQHDEMK